MTGHAERARALLAQGDGNLTADSPIGLLYGCFSRQLARHLIEPIVGVDTWSWITTNGNTGAEGLVRRWMYHWGTALEGPELDDTPASVSGRPLSAVLVRSLPRALADAWRDAARIAGSDQPEDWRWSDTHQVMAAHTLSVTLPRLATTLDPVSVGIGGDSDTIQAASITVSEPPSGPAFKIGGLSVYRQVVDFTGLKHATWVIPGGTSGLPGTSHYGDQIEYWRQHQRYPMHSLATDVAKIAKRLLVLEPV
jgi:penicillin amidase